MAWKGEVHQVSRGGEATYHGPGQVVVYPIINLKRRECDIGRLLRGIESSLISTLKNWNVESEPAGTTPTGVWVDGKKVASIGIAVRRWVTYHGLALNLYADDLAFQGITPCGFPSSTMISLEEILGKKVARKEFEDVLCDELVKIFTTKPNL